MVRTHSPSARDSGSAYYTICLMGHLDDGWALYPEHMRLTRESDGTTLLHGLVDQAALHGLLRKIRDSGIVLLSVLRTESVPNNNLYTGAKDE